MQFRKICDFLLNHKFKLLNTVNDQYMHYYKKKLTLLIWKSPPRYLYNIIILINLGLK